MKSKMKSKSKLPKCMECGKTMTEWSTLGLFYCKKCEIIFDPDKDERWHTHTEE